MPRQLTTMICRVCGNSFSIRVSDVQRGRGLYCGRACTFIGTRRPVLANGDRVERWTVLDEAPQRPGGREFHCRCDCGETSIVREYALTSGTSKSCGCLQREIAGDLRRTHGQVGTPEYDIWRGMIYRCHNPGDKAFVYYGARGIVVCDRWRESVLNFIEDMGPRPSPKHSVDRRENDGPYSPENCYWATQPEQMGHTRRSHWLTFNSETRILTEWAAIIGVSPCTIHSRLRKGWTIERTLTEPANEQYRRFR